MPGDTRKIGGTGTSSVTAGKQQDDGIIAGSPVRRTHDAQTAQTSSFVGHSSSIRVESAVEVPKADKVAAKVMTRRTLIDDIETYRQTNTVPTELLAEAQKLFTALQNLGDDQTTVATKLRLIAKRTQAYNDITRLKLLRNEAERLSFEATHILDDAAADAMMTRLEPQIQAWLDENKPALDPSAIRKTVHAYVLYRDAEKAGVPSERLTHSETALQRAMHREAMKFTTEADQKALGATTNRLVHTLLYEESKRGRRAIQATAHGVAATPLAPASYSSPLQLQRAMGAELSSAIDQFYDAILSGRRGTFNSPFERREGAQTFLRLVSHYMRYAANAYGTELGARVREHGLELRFLQATATHVDEKFDDPSLHLFRAFFIEGLHLSAPEVSRSLVYGATSVSPDSARSGFLPAADTMSAYTAPIEIDAGAKADFVAQIGIGFPAVQNWGGIQKGKKPSDPYPENVTVEPARRDALDAMLPAYHFLQRRAAEQALPLLDVMDYLGAIYPIARRIRDRAEPDGTIRVVVPSFMRGQLAFHNWGYSTWAQRVYQGLPTEVVPRTLGSHMYGETEHPQYETIRQYTAPLALWSGGGAEKERELYEFAFLMRIMHLLDNAVPVYDESGRLVTNPSPGALTRFRLQLVDDDAEYAEGVESAADSRSALFSDARRGVFDRELEGLGSYFEAIRLLPASVSLTDVRNDRGISLSDLIDRHERLLREHAVYRAALADHSPMAAYRSHEEQQRMVDFYHNVRSFERAVLYDTRIRGMFSTPRGGIPFQTMVRSAGNAVVLTSGEAVTIAVDDVADVAGRESWSDTRVGDVLRARIIFGHLRATGEIEAVSLQTIDLERILKPWWEGAIPTQVARDYLQLEKLASEAVRRSLLPRQHPTGGTNLTPAPSKAVVHALSFPHRELNPSETIEEQLAHWAVEDYVGLFPTSDFQLPANPHLLTTIAQYHLAEHASQHIDRRLVIATTRHLLRERNQQREEAPWASGLPAMATHGLLRDRIGSMSGGEADQTSVRELYFQALPDLLHGDATAASGHAQVDDFLRLQTRDLERVMALFGDDEIDVLAAAYATARLTTSLPYDLNVASRDLVDPVFAPYEDVTEWISHYYQDAVVRRLHHIAEGLAREVDNAHSAAQIVAEGTDLPETFDRYAHSVATMAEAASLAGLAQAERDEMLFAGLTAFPPLSSLPSGRQGGGQGVVDQVLHLYNTSIIPRRVQRDAERAALAAQVAELQSQSSALAVDFAVRPAIETMAEDAVRSLQVKIEGGLTTADLLKRRANVMGASAITSSIAATELTITSWKSAAEQRLEAVQNEANAKTLADKINAYTRELRSFESQVLEIERQLLQAQRSAASPIAMLRQDALTAEQFDEAVSRLSQVNNNVHDQRGQLDALGSKFDAFAPERASLLLTPASSRELARAVRDLTSVMSRFVPYAVASRAFHRTRQLTVRLSSDTKAALLAGEQHFTSLDQFYIPRASSLGAEEIEIDDKLMGFDDSPPDKDYRPKVQSRWKPYLDLRIFVATQGKTILFDADAQQVAKWLVSDRKREVTVKNIFGKTIPLAERSFGYRLESEPFHLLAVRHILEGNNSREAEFLYRLASSEALAGASAQATLLNDLVATCFQEQATTVDGTRSVIRRWALANREKLIAAYGAQLDHFFVEKSKASTRDAAKVAPAGYYNEMADAARASMQSLEHPD
ncbi:MAG: hypothetical protein HY540_02685, partial [Deltaproteobacteria bacterium]|nr:hypothetical protein [Deltaproteobacteria bacterium]